MEINNLFFSTEHDCVFAQAKAATELIVRRLYLEAVERVFLEEIIKM